MIKFMLQLTAALVACYGIGFAGLFFLADTTMTTMIILFLMLITSAYISLLAQATLKIMNHREKIKYNLENDDYNARAAGRFEAYLKSRESYIGDDGEIMLYDETLQQQLSGRE